jgi:hypothetical protein
LPLTVLPEGVDSTPAIVVALFIDIDITDVVVRQDKDRFFFLVGVGVTNQIVRD